MSGLNVEPVSFPDGDEISSMTASSDMLLHLMPHERKVHLSHHYIEQHHLFLLEVLTRVTFFLTPSRHFIKRWCNSFCYLCHHITRVDFFPHAQTHRFPSPRLLLQIQESSLKCQSTACGKHPREKKNITAQESREWRPSLNQHVHLAAVYPQSGAESVFVSGCLH